jgi:3-oxoacyl-[acyl-carrier protein] reductase
MKLDGVTAVISGGAAAVGQSTILSLAREGANIASIDLVTPSEQEDLIRKVEAMGRQAIALQGDITSKESVDDMINKVLETFGKIDLLVNVAGITKGGPLEQISVEDWDLIMAVNVKGTFLCSVACVSPMRKQGRGNIINIAAASAHRCAALSGAFGPSKAAVVSMTKQMAVEWAKFNIRVNGVSPGALMTPRNMQRIEATRERIKNIPLGRLGYPEEIANAIVFLASEDSSYMTGQVLTVDGGGVETWWLYP